MMKKAQNLLKIMKLYKINRYMMKIIQNPFKYNANGPKSAQTR